MNSLKYRETWSFNEADPKTFATLHSLLNKAHCNKIHISLTTGEAVITLAKLSFTRLNIKQIFMFFKIGKWKYLFWLQLDLKLVVHSSEDLYDYGMLGY